MNEVEEILPLQNELPSDFADRLGLIYNTKVDQSHKKSAGQFFTPVEIARFMGKQAELSNNEISILDPGCGTGILACSLVEHLINNENINRIKLVAYETDNGVISYSQQSFNYLKAWLERKKVEIEIIIINKDFILEKSVTNSRNNQLSIVEQDATEKFNIIICNPPYYKLSNSDTKVKANGSIISGQINIYALFIAVSIELLEENGQLIFITPRSFCSGNYFRTFRKFLLSRINITLIHLFESRTQTFNRDSVLQETLIFRGIPKVNSGNRDIRITSSNGVEGLENPQADNYSDEEIIVWNSKDKIIHLPVNKTDREVINLFRKWNNKLIDFNIQISTGPVVAFRSADFISENIKNGDTYVPLYWLHNVQKMFIQWPKIKPNKGQYIKLSTQSLPILSPNRNYILLRRFSAKGDKSRLIASPYSRMNVDYDLIGIENKLNYIYKINSDMDKYETMGLSVLLNSRLFDTYFRTFNGSINVSATELRSMPVPPLETIKEIGEQVLNKKEYSQEMIDKTVHSYFNFKFS